MKIRSFVGYAPYGLLLVSLSSLWLSYQPLVNLGSFSGVHIDLSLLYVFVSLCVVLSLNSLWKNLSTLAQQPLWLILFGFTIISNISMLWSPNNFRALVTVTFSWLIFAFVSTIVVHYPQLRTKRKQLLTTTASVGLLSAIWAVWQIVGDALAVTDSLTLLPQAYQGDIFGVARPTGFALEPQFFGSLLIAPICWFMWQFLTKKPTLPLIAGYVLALSLLVLTLSRGAILGAVIATVVLFLIARPSLRQYFLPLATVAMGVLLPLLLIFGFAALRHDSISGYDSLRRSVNHLSLGVVSLPTVSDEKKNTPSAVKPTNASDSGYVESSTTSRLSSSESALSLWTQSPFTILFGVGIGGFGASLVETNDDALNNIVNNYYLEILAELGVIGLGVLLTFFGLLLFTLMKRKQWLLVSIICGFLVQLCFFSGNANILHVWAIIGLSLAVLYPKKSLKLRKS